MFYKFYKSNLRSPGFQEKSSTNNNVKQTIDCEVLFLTDSNLHKMNVDIMNHGTVAQKIFCPQIRDIEYILRNNVCKRKPPKIYVQCGTNDIEAADFDMGVMNERISNMINALSETLLDDEGEIIIASLLPRSDNMDKVKLLNEFLIKITRKIRSAKFMANNNITDRMLKDRKHLDLKGC